MSGGYVGSLLTAQFFYKPPTSKKGNLLFFKFFKVTQLYAVYNKFNEATTT